MTQEPNRISVSLETLLDSVNLAEGITERVAKAAGFPEGDCQKISMAVREGVINAIRYGNEEQRHKKVRLSIRNERRKSSWSASSTRAAAST